MKSKVIQKNVVVFSILIMAVSLAITFIPLDSLFVTSLGQQSSEYLSGIIEQVLVSLVLIVILKKLDLLKDAGFTKPKEWKDLWIVWPMVLFAIFNGSNVFFGDMAIDYSNPLRIVLFILVYLSTGLLEETLCRGVILSVMIKKWGSTKKGYYGALLLSSTLFGFSHIIHYFMHHTSFLATMTQVVYAIFIGVFFGACVLRNKSIYPAIILHGIVDITGGFKEIAVNGGIDKTYHTMSVSNAVALILITLPFLLYGLFIVRKIKK